MSGDTDLGLDRLREDVLEPNREEIKRFIRWEFHLALELKEDLEADFEDEDVEIVLGDTLKKVDDVATDVIGDWFDDFFGDVEEEEDKKDTVTSLDPEELPDM
jgi:hypothetical protein